MRALVHGLAITGASTVRALQRRGIEVLASDDQIDVSKVELAAELGVELVALPVDIDRFVASFELVSPAPGVPERHPLVTSAIAQGVSLQSEIEMAYRWEQERPGGPRPILAVTGTDGKTTTTLMAAGMLEAAGLKTLAVGNTEVPMLDALDLDLDAYVVECTSFRLAWTQQFRADAAVWLNLAPDHLNWHESIDTYIAAKARIFDLQRGDDIAIGFADDPIVMAHLSAAPGRHVTFASTAASDYRCVGDELLGPAGHLGSVSSMPRSFPHDITNALAAAALVLETGLVDPAHVADAVSTFAGPPHRIEPIGELDGIQFFNDSKATTPHAASVAIRSFDRVVLIAGGRNKQLDLSPMGEEPGRIRAVVAIGESASDIHAVFDQRCTVLDAESMEQAVEVAIEHAHAGDAVLLSPGCASFDWYPAGGYPARGDHFRRVVHDHLRRTGGTPS